MSAPSVSIPNAPDALDARWACECAELQVIVKPEEITVEVRESDAELLPEQAKYLCDEAKEQIQRLMENYKIKTYPPTLHMARKMIGHRCEIRITPQKGGHTKQIHLDIRDATSSQAVVKHKRAVFKVVASISQSAYSGRFSSLCLHKAEEGITPWSTLCLLEHMDGLGPEEAKEYIKRLVKPVGRTEPPFEGPIRLATATCCVKDELSEFFQISTNLPHDNSFIRALVNSVCMDHLSEHLQRAYLVAHR